MVEKPDLTVASWPYLVRDWWQLVIISIGLAAAVLGFLYISFKLVRKLQRHFAKENRESKSVLQKVDTYLQSLAIASPISQSISEECKSHKPTSFRIYLGAFDKTLTADQAQILSDWDLIILDPLQSNVVDAVAAIPRNRQMPHFVVGRLDLEALLDLPQHKLDREAFTIAAFERIRSLVPTHFQNADVEKTGFTGILLAGWEGFFSVSVLNKLCKHLYTLGLDVYLETGPPSFLNGGDAAQVESIAGLVIRNGLILPNGKRRDCFDMQALRPAIKAFMSQECLRSFTTMMWESLDDDAVVEDAVVKRTFSWCRFHSTLSWIAPHSALLNARPDIGHTEPLSAFNWLKDANVMQIHDLWRNSQAVTCASRNWLVFKPLTALFPALNSIWEEDACELCGSSEIANISASSHCLPEWIGLNTSTKFDTLSISQTGSSYDRCGCFPIGVDITIDDFVQVVQSQRNLRRLELLDAISSTALREFGTTLRDFLVQCVLPGRSSITSSCQNILQELSSHLINTPDDGAGGVRVYRGLDAGFQRSPEKRFWAVYYIHASQTTDIYVSKNAGDLISTALHTFLSSRGCTRRQCFEIEVLFAKWSGNLPSGQLITRRIIQDVEMLAPSESLSLLQQITLCDSDSEAKLLKDIQAAVEEQLLKRPSSVQLKNLNAIDYLKGASTAENLISSRLRSHCEHNLHHPSTTAALHLFLEVEVKIQEILKSRRTSDLEMITHVLRKAFLHSCMDTVADIVALAVFCVMRKLAFEEIYIEVTDRNPLFNNQSDQAAAFAELFALGSRCEAYFDMSPNNFGKLLLERYHAEYMDPQHQPPMYEESTMPLRSAYAEAQMDVDSSAKPSEMPTYQRFTFLSVFAIPALIDVLLLTTIKHGLYLTADMTKDEIQFATIAFMVSLLLSGAIGTWIACGGSYYLSSMAFSAMNYFVITRLLGGFAFLLLGASVGFITISFTNGIHAALIFFLYLIVLTSYLSLLAALANYNFNGTAFQSGRIIIISCIPILFISPVTTILVKGHDSTIYLTVLYVFVSLLLLGTRYIGSQWTTWYHNIALVDDITLREWYIQRETARNDAFAEKISEPALLKTARENLLHEVLKTKSSFFQSKSTSDPLVSRLAKCHDATLFLMNWYSHYSGMPKPIPFSSTWNVQSKVALKTIKQLQKGIRFHNGFFHWRQAGDEIGCTILYFIIALLDKWIALLTGSNPLGFLPNSELRFPVGFGLAYYLIGAVLLDFNAHKLHELASRDVQEVVEGEDKLPYANKMRLHRRTLLYWRTLRRYLFLHSWSLAVAATLLWIFSKSEQSVILFLSYVVSYTGLLWYQYTKTFSGPHALKPLLIGVSVGLPLGFILRSKLPNFLYGDVVALGVATWTVAILSLWAVKIVSKIKDRPILALPVSYHAMSAPGVDQEWSQYELRMQYDSLLSLPDKLRSPVDPDSYLGGQVKLILKSCTSDKFSSLAKQAFPSADSLIDQSSRAFEDGTVTIELISLDHMRREDMTMRALSCESDNAVRILVGCEVGGIAQQQIAPDDIYNIAEVLLHMVAEKFLGYNHDHSTLIECLLTSRNPSHAEMQIPYGIKSHIEAAEELELSTTLRNHFKGQLLQGLCLGLSPDLQWDRLPENIRKYLVKRCLGQSNSLSESQSRYLRSTLCEESGLGLDVYIARYDYAAFIAALCYSRATTSPAKEFIQNDSSQGSDKAITSADTLLLESSTPGKWSIFKVTRQLSSYVYHKAGTVCKFFAVAFVADADYHRELDCVLSDSPNIVAITMIFFLSCIWVFSKNIQRLLLPWFLFHNRGTVIQLWKSLQGVTVSFKRLHIIVQTLEGRYTAFIHRLDDGTTELIQYRGEHEIEPEGHENLCFVNTYSSKMALLRRKEIQGGKVVNTFEYEYWEPDAARVNRLSRTDMARSPLSRRCVGGQNQLQVVNYNRKGLIESGSYFKDGNLIRFQYHYRRDAKFKGELLRAEFVLPHMSCNVSWCAPPPRQPEKLDKWISHSEVTEATFVIGENVWESKYIYDHKLHPTIVTTLNGQPVDSPPLILYDHLDVLKKPQNTSFLDDNPLDSFTSFSPNTILRWLGYYKRSYPMSTSQGRSLLWKAWKDSSDHDGVVMRWLDERLLRRDAVLSRYWRMRDFGRLISAETYLEQNADAVMASIDLDNSISSWTPLAITLNDLSTFGPGGDACARTRSNLTSQEEDSGGLHVIAVDTGTWPNEGGGVSACRRDVVNNLKTIKWHMVAESATDFGIPKYQIEKNVHSLKVLPLWGLDLMTPTHGLFLNRLDSEIEHIPRHADLEEIDSNFVPILAALVSGARSLELSIGDIKQTTRALVALNEYFRESKHWNVVWKSDVVKNAWRRLWLSKLSHNARPYSEWLRTELPTLGQLDQALDLWSRYLFIFSIQVPEEMPDVFQASHHSVSASYGIVCKIKRQCTLQIWDHAISWRETNLYLSSALCPLAPFVRNCLLGLMRMTSVLILHHADTILPCADFFNPNWEIEIGTCGGSIEHRNTFKRKIDPVVNGITDMQRFTPLPEIKTKTPTVTMLSHVWYAKDIKTAILAADVIVNEWGFKEYHLDIYGALDKAPSYSTSCQEIISTKSLREFVTLHGEADAVNVLEQTWLFLNSSISEGLPLALGEAALTGAPIVCTDVGASLRVLTDPNTNERYSAVVAPNDPVALARAQINLLAMLGEWQMYADSDTLPTVSSSASSNYSRDESGSGTGSLNLQTPVQRSLTKLPESPTKEEVEIITGRMYEQTAARRRLGMLASAIVQKSFSGERYLREHEQMLWVGKAKKDMRLAAEGSRRLTHEPVSVPVDVSVRAGNGMMDDIKVVVERSDSCHDISMVEKAAESSVGSEVLTGCPPSLGFGTSAEVTSVSTGSISMVHWDSVMVDSQVIKMPQVALIDIKGLRREERRLSEV